ncbi:hypothetical protein [Pedobacter immunditicola]|uniref:hypothetical protein n=1 Tax=Pedobacter immunditicola TaxID=3133440 RepID=UPI0030A9FB1F
MNIQKHNETMILEGYVLGRIGDYTLTADNVNEHINHILNSGRFTELSKEEIIAAFQVNEDEIDALHRLNKAIDELGEDFKKKFN